MSLVVALRYLFVGSFVLMYILNSFVRIGVIQCLVLF